MNFLKIAQSFSVWVRNASTQYEMKWPGKLRITKRACLGISKERRKRNERVGLLLDKDGLLVPGNQEKAELLTSPLHPSTLRRKIVQMWMLNF